MPNIGNQQRAPSRKTQIIVPKLRGASLHGLPALRSPVVGKDARGGIDFRIVLDHRETVLTLLFLKTEPLGSPTGVIAARTKTANTAVSRTGQVAGGEADLVDSGGGNLTLQQIAKTLKPSWPDTALSCLVEIAGNCCKTYWLVGGGQGQGPYLKDYDRGIGLEGLKLTVPPFPGSWNR